MFREDPYLRDSIAQLFSSAIDDVVREHINRLSQEPQITSKIADRIEQAAQSWTLGKYKLSARAQDLPDRGPRSLEKPTGTDLYIGIRLEDEKANYKLEKGLLIQSKISTKITTAEHKKLVSQCELMTTRSTSGSFVWLYDDLGVKVIPANEIAANPGLDARDIFSRNTTEFFRDVLDCFLGDRNLVWGSIFDDIEALNNLLRELAISKGIVINIDAVE